MFNIIVKTSKNITFYSLKYYKTKKSVNGENYNRT